MTVNPLFQSHKLNAAGVAKSQEISEVFDVLLGWLRPLCTVGREFALVQTKLEEAAFYAKKAMAFDIINQEQK